MVINIIFPCFYFMLLLVFCLFADISELCPMVGEAVFLPSCSYPSVFLFSANNLNPKSRQKGALIECTDNEVKLGRLRTSVRT